MDGSGSDDGGDVRQVAGLSAPCDHPNWHPDGASLVVACFRFANRQDDGALWLAEPDIGVAQILYDGPGLQKSPAWSPDGRHVAFVSGFRLSATRVVEHIWMIDADGTGAEPLEDGSDVTIDPAWLDDNRLVFSSDRGGDVSLWQRDLDTGDRRQLTSGRHADTAAAPAPNGDAVVFVSTREGREGLWSLSLDDLTITPLATPGLEAAREPTWTGAMR